MKRFYQFLNVVILISFISCQQFEINVEKTVKMTTIFRFKMTTIFGAK